MKKYIVIILILFVCTACDDFFETDISSNEIEIIAPVDGVRIPAGDITFRWLPVDHAVGYRFMLVQPSFDAARMLADTLISADSIARTYGCLMNLKTGKYEWSVEAFNSSYVSERCISSLTVIEAESK